MNFLEPLAKEVFEWIKTSDDLIVPGFGNAPYIQENQISPSRWQCYVTKFASWHFAHNFFSSSNASFKQINRSLWLCPQILCPGYSNSSKFSNSYWTLQNAGIFFPLKYEKLTLLRFSQFRILVLIPLSSSVSIMLKIEEKDNYEDLTADRYSFP